MEKFIQLGKEFGLEGGKLLAFVLEKEKEEKYQILEVERRREEEEKEEKRRQLEEEKEIRRRQL